MFIMRLANKNTLYYEQILYMRLTKNILHCANYLMHVDITLKLSSRTQLVQYSDVSKHDGGRDRNYLCSTNACSLVVDKNRNKMANASCVPFISLYALEVTLTANRTCSNVFLLTSKTPALHY